MDLRLLTALDAVAVEGTFGAAAARLGYSQSSLSQQIAALERSVGGPVFDRPGGPRRVRLTPLGALVLEQGRDLLARSRTAQDAIERFRSGGGRVDIGTFQTVTKLILPEVVARLRSEQPDCEVRLVEDETETPDLEGLDLMFFDGPAPGCDERPVFADPHVVVALRGAFADVVALGDLHGAPMVAFPPICDQGRQVEATLADAGVVPDVVFRTSDNEAVVAMVRAGLGCAVMPRLSVVAATRDPDLVVLPLTPDLPWRQVNLLSQGTLSPIARRVVELALEVAGRLAPRVPAGAG